MSVSVSSKGHRYDRIIPAPLPIHRMITRAAPALSPVADLRSSCGPIKNQGNLGSCTGHAGTSAVEWIFRRYLKQAPVLSPLFAYSEELLAQGSFPQDTGSDGVTLCDVLISKGACLDSLYPDSSGQILQPTSVQLTDALTRRMGAYHGLSGSVTAHSILADPVPWPVLIGFTVYESFEGDQVAETGIMPVPAASEQLLGGHEVLIVGCDLGASPSMRPSNSLPSFLVQNSWGTSWGIGGFFWMPAQILDAPTTDLKIVHIGKPWSLSPSKN